MILHVEKCTNMQLSPVSYLSSNSFNKKTVEEINMYLIQLVPNGHHRDGCAVILREMAQPNLLKHWQMLSKTNANNAVPINAT